MQYKEHIGIYALIINDHNEIILIKKARGPYKNMLDLPGGTADFNESFLETLQREILEETGLILTAHKQLGVVLNHVQDVDIKIRHIAIIYSVKTTGRLKTEGDGKDSNGTICIPLQQIHSYNVNDIVLKALTISQ